MGLLDEWHEGCRLESDLESFGDEQDVGAGGGPACLRSFENPADYSEPMSPPSSPRLRQTTFGATLDFIEALCDCSANLTAFAPEDRQVAHMP